MLGELTVEILQREYDMLKETNPMNVERLKRKIILEYLRQRVTMMQQKEEIQSCQTIKYDLMVSLNYLKFINFM